MQRLGAELLRHRVDLISISAKGIQAILAILFIPPDVGEHRTQCADAVLDLQVGNDPHRHAAGARDLFYGLASPELLCARIVRKPDGVDHIAKGLHDGEVVRPWPLHVLVAADDAVFQTDLLCEPQGRMIRPAKVTDDAHRLGHVIPNACDPSALLGIAQFTGVDRAIKRLPAMTLPDVQICIRVAALQVFTLVSENVRKPRVVAPAHLDDGGILWRVRHEPLVGFVRFQFGVKGNPDFRPVLADRRDQSFPRIAGHVMSFFDPYDIDGFLGFQAIDVVTEARENELAASQMADDGRFLDLIHLAEAHGLDLIGKEFVDGILDRNLELTRAKYAELFLCGKDQKCASYAPAFRATATTMQNFVTLGLKQERQLLGELYFAPRETKIVSHVGL